MKIHPLPGNMVIKLESLLKSTQLIEIPKRYQKAPRLIGRITAISMRPEDVRALGIELVVGNRIVVTPLGGRYLEESTWIYPISVVRKDERGRKYWDGGVLAIVPDIVDMSAHSEDVPRCQFCGEVNGSKQNMILWQDTCPRCGKDRQDEIPDKSLKVTDADIKAYKNRAKVS